MTKRTQRKSTKVMPADAPAAFKSMEKLMAALISGDEDGAESDLGRAQDIMWTAWDSGNSKQRIMLAKRALAISPLCADAFVMLALETAKTADDRIALYRQGVDAGEKALGEQAFKEDVGMFWGILETRPYMRARQGLASELWESGAREEAVAHWKDMLRLNPNDNQGMRYGLLDHLLELGRDGDAGNLLKKYKDDSSAWWTYGRALLAFRASGDCEAARKALKKALAFNRFVPAYLTGAKALPRRLPEFYGMGDEREAIFYALTGKAAWAAAPGAVEWLEDRAG